MTTNHSAIIWRLIGESAREIGILVLVFGPLDAAIKHDSTSTGFAILTAATGLIFVAIGIHIESSPPRGTT